MQTLNQLSFVGFRVRSGDDASCLNLYQPHTPRLLGVPHSLIRRPGFLFAESEAHSFETQVNPWLLLEEPREDGAIPVIGEENTVVWMLKSGLGGVVEVTDERGDPVKLHIVGLLRDSVFQSGLLMSEANFKRLYPNQQGFNFFLIDTRDASPRGAKEVLETVLADQGFTATPSADRVASYLAVENTYLSTFQALGGLGLMLGAVGLAVVLLRGVWERRAELALLQALGYRRATLGGLVLGENGFLLVYGLGAGAAAAFVAVLPQWWSGEGSVPLLRLVILLGAVVVVGGIAATAALAGSLRKPLVPALRRE
jgi:ABC-type antimicrobial peptide transport system permease subunit